MSQCSVQLEHVLYEILSVTYGQTDASLTEKVSRFMRYFLGVGGVESLISPIFHTFQFEQFNIDKRIYGPEKSLNLETNSRLDR